MKAARIVVLLWTGVCLWGLFEGFGNLDAQRLEQSDLYAAGAAVGLFLWVGIWMLVVVPVTLIGLLFRNKGE